MNRVALIRLLAVLLIAGILLSAVPFLSSFSPSERSVSELPSVKLPDLLPGQFTFIEDPLATNQWPSKLMLLRQMNGELFVWSIPTRNGVIAMPDIHWWRPGKLCPSFAPDFSTGAIACADPTFSAWEREHLRWRLDGKSISGVIEEMPRIQGQERSGEFVYGMHRG